MPIVQVQRIESAELRHYPTKANFMLTNLGENSYSMKEEVLAGLQRYPKSIPSKYFYDAEGSRLFDEICNLPEYYPTRMEISILNRYADVILDRLGGNLCIIELGAGGCQKARLLLETGNASTFFPVDISKEHLRDAARRLADSFPHVGVHAVAMDFLADLESLEPLLPTMGRRVIFYAGSSIGNFDPPHAWRLLRQFGDLLHEGDALLIGYDLRKDPNRLRRAYNDSAGITAAFNLNLLTRINRELEADFDVNAFRHVALYNESLCRIEMHIESLAAQDVTVANKGIRFEVHERIHTENSYKYSIDGFRTMAAAGGFDSLGVWTDPAANFAVELYAKR